MPKVVLVSDSDSPGYKRLLLDGPVGQSQAGEIVEIDLKDSAYERADDGSHLGGAYIIAHGQRELDVPADAVKVSFPDGTSWKPK